MSVVDNLRPDSCGHRVGMALYNLVTCQVDPIQGITTLFWECLQSLIDAVSYCFNIVFSACCCQTAEAQPAVTETEMATDTEESAPSSPRTTTPPQETSAPPSPTQPTVHLQLQTPSPTQRSANLYPDTHKTTSPATSAPPSPLTDHTPQFVFQANSPQADTSQPQFTTPPSTPSREKQFSNLMRARPTGYQSPVQSVGLANLVKESPAPAAQYGLANLKKTKTPAQKPLKFSIDRL